MALKWGAEVGGGDKGKEMHGEVFMMFSVQSGHVEKVSTDQEMAGELHLPISSP